MISWKIERGDQNVCLPPHDYGIALPDSERSPFVQNGLGHSQEVSEQTMDRTMPKGIWISSCGNQCILFGFFCSLPLFPFLSKYHIPAVLAAGAFFIYRRIAPESKIQSNIEAGF